MKPIRATLPELTRLYLRACEILKIFDSDDGQSNEKEEGNTPSSDAQLVPDSQEKQTGNLSENDASPSQSPVVL